MPTNEELLAQLKRFNAELDRRTARHRKVEPYFEPLDTCIIPQAIVQAKLTNAYRLLMSMAETPWGKPIVNAKLDRLEVTGLEASDKNVARMIWEQVWQANSLDLESKLGHQAALIDGRFHTLIWPGRRGPTVTLDDVTQMVVEYAEGSRRERTAAMRRWRDDDDSLYATLYRPDGIYKFRQRAKNETGGDEWRRRDVEGEAWPLPNPLGIVPVVELGVNRRLKPGRFAHCRGEYEDVTGIMDRINLLTFLGLVVALWMGFPLRGVIGDRIVKDDDGNQIPPFDVHADGVFQLENPEAKLAEFAAADRKNLSVFPELTELSAATTTPRHYLPMDGGISNVSEPTIRAFEGGMHATVNASHKPSLGEGWEETCRVGALMLDDDVELEPSANILWADHESRSLGERADAALKLQQAGLPWQAVATIALNLNQDQIRQYEAAQSSSALAQIIRAAQQPTDTPAPATA